MRFLFFLGTPAHPDHSSFGLFSRSLKSETRKYHATAAAAYSSGAEFVSRKTASNSCKAAFPLGTCVNSAYVFNFLPGFALDFS